MILTVIFRDDEPMVCAGDSPSYRSVSIELDEDQVKMLTPRKSYTSGGKQYHEVISKCFIEPDTIKT
jgi:hypothetical protein